MNSDSTKVQKLEKVKRMLLKKVASLKVKMEEESSRFSMGYDTVPKGSIGMIQRAIIFHRNS